MTSKKLNVACCDQLITNREVVTINEVYQPFVYDVFSTLTKSERNIINLKFCSVPPETDTPLFLVDDASSYFWLNYGTKIRYLEFSSCEIPSDTLLRILMCCPNLNGFSYDRVGHNFDEALKLLLDNNKILQRVTFLSLIHSSFDIGSLYNLLPKVFPNVRNLNIGISDDFSQHRKSVKSFLEASLPYILSLAPNLEYLKLGFSPAESNILSRYALAQKNLTNILAVVKQYVNFRVFIYTLFM